jgi:hypothetical protein
MKTYVQAQGFAVGQLVANVYRYPAVPRTNENERKLNLNNSKSKNALLNGLGYSVYGNVMHCNSSK